MILINSQGIEEKSTCFVTKEHLPNATVIVIIFFITFHSRHALVYN